MKLLHLLSSISQLLKSTCIRTSFTWLSLLLAVSLIVVGCDGQSSIVSEDSKDIVPERSEVQTFEIVDLRVTSDKALGDRYEGSIGGSSVELLRTTDTTLTFSVPDVESGKHHLDFELGKVSLEVTRTEIADPEATVAAVFDNFDAQISSFSPSTDAERESLEKAVAFKEEVSELYNSLSEEEKRQVAAFYEANKRLFAGTGQASKAAGAPTRYAHRLADCPKTNFKTYYGCTAGSLGTSAQDLKANAKDFLQMLGLAGASAYLAPTTFGLSAVGTALALGTAGYLFFTDVQPSFIRFKTDAGAFLGANWIFTKALFLTVQEEFANDKSQDLNLDPKFRSITPEDTDVSSETGYFLDAMSQLRSLWNKLSAVLGGAPEFTSSEEPAVLEGDDITISNISNPDVQLASQSGSGVAFTSSAGGEQAFSFDLRVEKEGFVEETTVDAKLLPYTIELTGLWELHFYSDDTRTQLNQTDLIDFQNGAEDVGLPISTTYYSSSGTTTSDRTGSPATWNQAFVQSSSELKLTNNYWTNIAYYFKADPDHEGGLIGYCAGLCNDGYNMELRKQ